MIQRNAQTLQNVCTSFSLLQFKLRTSANNLNLMLQVVIQHFTQVQDFRFFIHNRKHVNSESGLH
ncbi:hypothetical protein D3C74_319630 [compost metagenome]